MANTLHTTVMLNEAINALNIDPDGIYIDATFGRGGHSKAILEKLSDKGKLIAFDKDLAAIEYAKSKFSEYPNFEIIHGCFSESFAKLVSLGYANKILGILLDLGVCSTQLDEGDRGFSFMHDGPLDMRMDKTNPMSAEQWLNNAEYSEIAHVINKYGEDKNASFIAKLIIEHRPFNSTKQLANLLEAKLVKTKYSKKSGKSGKSKHPATKTFQAIRIFINNEITALEQSLQVCAKLLSKRGRLAIISFHSLEDRIVKRFMQQKTTCDLPKDIPILEGENGVDWRWVLKQSPPTDLEISSNARARSARLRVIEKIN